MSTKCNVNANSLDRKQFLPHFCGILAPCYTYLIASQQPAKYLLIISINLRHILHTIFETFCWLGLKIFSNNCRSALILSSEFNVIQLKIPATGLNILFLISSNFRKWYNSHLASFSWIYFIHIFTFSHWFSTLIVYTSFRW